MRPHSSHGERAGSAHGSRVPGWDEPATSRRTPRTIPDPALTPVPDAICAREIEAQMAQYPDRQSAAIPALRRRSASTAGARRRRSSRSPA